MSKQVFVVNKQVCFATAFVINFCWTCVPTLPSQTVLVLYFMGMKHGNCRMEAQGKIRDGKESETKAKTKAKDENPTFIVNSLLFFMNQRHKSKVLDSTFQMMLNYYNVETISEAKALLHNKIAPEKKVH